MKQILSMVFGIFCLSSNAAEGPYAVSKIPEPLMKDANIVCRTQEEVYQIHSLSEASLKRKVVLTILNDKGDRHASMVMFYSSMSKVSRFDGMLYNAAGELISKLKSKEIIDRSHVSDISIMEDNRIKFHDFEHRTYPYTVQYETEEKIFQTYGIPDWVPQTMENYSIQKSSYTFIAPSDYVIRYKAINYKGAPVEAVVGNNKSYTWEVNNLPVIIKPFASPKWYEITTNVQFAPSRFEMSGYKGNAASWEEFGKFAQSLNAGRDVLPPAIASKVAELTQGVQDEKQKIRILYEFLQKNTRYISIQLGIGGLQPFEASFVAQKGYGDCKALSNYMYSLLKAAGIRSHYSLIYGGKDMARYNLMEDFPADAFNHIVLCVPLAKDSVWLECTSQTEPAGYMGSFTGNRHALLITENGGKLVSTVKYGLKENQTIRKLDAKITADGRMDAKVFATYKCTEQDRLNSIINNYPKDKLQQFLQEEYDDLGTYTVNSFHHEIVKDVFPQIEENLDVTAFAYATISGKRMFIVPNAFNRQGMRISLDTPRIFDYVLDAEFRNEDRVTIEIPEGYQLESAFQDINIKTKYGNYSASAKLEGNKIVYTRIREQFKGRYSPKEGEAIIKYYNDIFKADRARLVFVKNQ